MMNGESTGFGARTAQTGLGRPPAEYQGVGMGVEWVTRYGGSHVMSKVGPKRYPNHGHSQIQAFEISPFRAVLPAGICDSPASKATHCVRYRGGLAYILCIAV